MTQNAMVLFGKKVQDVRLRRNLSTRDFASILGCSTAGLKLIEKGFNGTSFYQISQIARILNISLDKLIFTPSVTPKENTLLTIKLTLGPV